MKVRYYGHVQQATGYGHAARELVRALVSAGAEVEVRTIGPRDLSWDPGDLSELLAPVGAPDAIIVHTLPGDCGRVLELEGLRRGAGPKLVAYTTWEALTAPLEVVAPLYEGFDQVWSPSRPCALSLATNGTHANASDRKDAESRTHVIPHTYNPDRDLPVVTQRGDVYRFYWVGAWTARKNPGGLVRAFAYAFAPGDAVELVLHSPRCALETYAATLAATGLRQADLPAVRLSGRHLSQDELEQLHASADCFVSAARGEAWNLPAFDALLARRHVIAQYGLGSDEYLTDTSADLVDGWESPAQVDVSLAQSEGGEVTARVIGAQGLSARSLWLEPNLYSMAEAMRAAYRDGRRGLDVSYDPAQRYGYAAVARQALNVLEA